MGYLSCKTESSVLISTKKETIKSKKEKKKIQQFTYKDLETATNGFSEQTLLGKGSHGVVYKAVLRDGKQVAVKKPTNQFTEISNEIEILSNMHSPRLVNLLGFTVDPVTPKRQRLLVVEFMSNGTLYQKLHCDAEKTGFLLHNWGRRVRMALQVARAVDDLHSCSPPVIHRDIKSANVLIDRRFNARLGDFGLALRCGSDGYHLRSTPPAGTMGYLDPCYVTPDNLSTKTDVFSFGILLLEMISGRKAIDMNYSPPSIVDWAIPLIRRGKFWGIYDPRIEPLKDPSVRKHLAMIAAKCVRSCRERRPSMKDVVECLSGLSKLVPLHSWNSFTNPCMMVETIGMPVGEPIRNVNNKDSTAEEKEENESSDGSMRIVLRGSRMRVYSDLGIKNNLIDLISYKANESRSEPQNSANNGRISKLSTPDRRISLFGGNNDKNVCTKGDLRVADTNFHPLM